MQQSLTLGLLSLVVVLLVVLSTVAVVAQEKLFIPHQIILFKLAHIQ